MIVLLFLIIYCILLKYIGYFIPTVILGISIIALLGYREKIKNILLITGITALIYIV